MTTTLEAVLEVSADEAAFYQRLLDTASSEYPGGDATDIHRGVPRRVVRR